MAGRLEAQLTVLPSEERARERFVARGALINVGDESLLMDVTPVSSPSLALVITDEGGSPLGLPPPPVPGGEPQKARLSPGERYAVEYANFLPQWTPPGTYLARLRYVYRPAAAEVDEWTGEAVSEPTTFRVLE